MNWLSVLLQSIPPEAWAAIITAVVTAVLANLRARGYNLPILNVILDAILRRNKPDAPAPNLVPTPNDETKAPQLGDGHIIKLILDELIRRKLVRDTDSP